MILGKITYQYYGLHMCCELSATHRESLLRAYTMPLLGAATMWMIPRLRFALFSSVRSGLIWAGSEMNFLERWVTRRSQSLMMLDAEKASAPGHRVMGCEPAHPSADPPEAI